MRRRVWIGFSLALISWVLLAPRGGHTSGSTQVSKTGEYYRFTLETPVMNFMTDPRTGRSGEQEYHHSARKQFEELLLTHETWIEKNVTVIRKEFGTSAKLVPYRPEFAFLSNYLLGRPLDAGKPPYRMSFMILFPDMGSLELAFGAAPSPQLHDAIAKRIKELFSAGPEGSS